MKRLVDGLAMVAFILLLALACLAPVPVRANGLSPEQTLRAENLQLRIQIAQLKATIADREQRLRIYEIALGQGVTADAQKDSATLSAEQVKLVEEFRATLHAKPDAEFDWTTLSFTRPKKTEEQK